MAMVDAAGLLRLLSVLALSTTLSLAFRCHLNSPFVATTTEAYTEASLRNISLWRTTVMDRDVQSFYQSTTVPKPQPLDWQRGSAR